MVESKKYYYTTNIYTVSATKKIKKRKQHQHKMTAMLDSESMHKHSVTWLIFVCNHAGSNLQFPLPINNVLSVGSIQSDSYSFLNAVFLFN